MDEVAVEKLNSRLEYVHKQAEELCRFAEIIAYELAVNKPVPPGQKPTDVVSACRIDVLFIQVEAIMQDLKAAEEALRDIREQVRRL